MTNLSKEVLHCEPVTDLLAKFNIYINPVEFNNLLIKHGYLEKDRKTITEKGSFYGENVKGSIKAKNINPRWYESKFINLVGELKTLEPDYFLDD